MKSRWSQDLFIKACRFAARAHRGQTVPGTDLPYLLHLTFVAMETMAALAAEEGRDGDLAVACALLHDVIEDTGATFREVRAAFGRKVADGVLALSKDKSLPHGSRLADSLRRIRRQPKEVWMVKLADRTANLQPPPPHWTRGKAAAYLGDAVRIRAALKDASPFLAARLSERIAAYKTFT